VFDRASFYLGRGFALMADILNPERIILGGLGVRVYDALVEPALKVFEAEALPESREVCRVVPAQLGEEIGDFASLCAALDQGGLSQVIQGSTP
jgi:glucokinase